MTKAEFISAVAEKSGLSKTDADKAVKATIDAITEALVKGDKVQFIGFGTFEVREKAESEARNPQKPGEKITVPAHKAPAFKPGAALKEAVK